MNNAHNNVVSVLPITSNVTKVFSFEVFLLKDTANQPKDSKAKADQIRTLDKSRFAKRIGILPTHYIIAIEKAILRHSGIEK